VGRGQGRLTQNVVSGHQSTSSHLLASSRRQKLVQGSYIELYIPFSFFVSTIHGVVLNKSRPPHAIYALRYVAPTFQCRIRQLDLSQSLRAVIPGVVARLVTEGSSACNPPTKRYCKSLKCLRVMGESFLSVGTPVLNELSTVAVLYVLVCFRAKANERMSNHER
jgi:hypothetical protein